MLSSPLCKSRARFTQSLFSMSSSQNPSECIQARNRCTIGPIIGPKATVTIM